VETRTLTACLLGSPTFVRDGLQVDVPGSCQPLLSYLLLQRNRHVHRPTLVYLIAPEGADASARRRLNTAVWRLRRSLDVGASNPIIVSDADGLTISPDCQIWVDVLDFETGCAHSRVPVDQWDGHDADTVAAAVEMYRGDLLEGVYDDWVLEQRARLADLHRTSLVRLAQWHRAHHDLDRAIGYAERAVATEPLREDLQRLLITLYLQAGLDDLAVTQFERCRALLAVELDVHPLPETTRLGGIAKRRSAAATGGDIWTGRVDVAAILADLRDAQAELTRLSTHIGRSIAALKAGDEPPFGAGSGRRERIVTDGDNPVIEPR
jgi:DNA-binding SARP family transcriptional activator